ncbi:MAG: hypothetical protein A3H96_27420 [Acidobacteria bacterium RIFCSPLOWO2_02_FULL_67_36]|nr:MAG: hypothetical protein A3H96_27420 [Acidobacteria bacterium RIFCSPLOWO2_02_FULL_67_36]OFW26399.1 MAG: hypothetical protein A3G21_27340 [Acidobacteria bacterium RIFCSPLOWO2_12_FULL_66_21]
MIIRTSGSALICITQPDHARLAAELMARWRALDDHPRRAAVLHAIRDHDNGWIEEDAATHVDANGSPLEFVAVPASVKQRIWPRAVSRLEQADPYVAALVAQHALTIHAPMRRERSWASFFGVIAARRDELAARAGGTATLDDDYRWVRSADLLSLIFCNGWRDGFDLPVGARAALTGGTLELAPDPFAGAPVPLTVPARRVEARTYASADAFRAALDAAPLEPVEGQAIGMVAAR